jgi:hypothetical protein
VKQARGLSSGRGAAIDELCEMTMVQLDPWQARGLGGVRFHVIIDLLYNPVIPFTKFPQD